MARLLSTCARNPIYVDVTFRQLDIPCAYWCHVVLSCKLIYLNIMSNKRWVANFFSFSRDWKCRARIDRKQSCENRTIFSYAIDALLWTAPDMQMASIITQHTVWLVLLSWKENSWRQCRWCSMWQVTVIVRPWCSGWHWCLCNILPGNRHVCWRRCIDNYIPDQHQSSNVTLTSLQLTSKPLIPLCQQ